MSNRNRNSSVSQTIIANNVCVMSGTITLHIIIGMILSTCGFHSRPLWNNNLSPRIFQRDACTMSSANGHHNRVCIIGGGFGGLYTALKLDAERTMDVTLIDSKDKFVFLPLLYELAVESATVLEVAPQYESLLKETKISFIQSLVNNIDFDKKIINIENNTRTLSYDQLVIAVGVRPRVDTIPGASVHALPFYTVDDAYNLRVQLRALKASNKPIIRVAVIGGGYSGVEVATNIAESIGKDRAIVSIIDRNSCVMHTSPDHNRLTAEKSLLSYGVSINCNTSVGEVTATHVKLLPKDGDEYDMPVDLVICTAGVQQSSLVSSLPLQKDASGRILTTATLQSTSHPDVFALGDCASILNYRLPSTAQVAMQQASIAAVNLAIQSAQITSDNVSTATRNSTTRLQKFRFVPLGEMLTLGRTDAAVTSLGGLVKLDGLPAAVARRLVYAARMPTVSQSVNAVLGAGIGAAGSLVSDLLSKRLARNKK